MQNHHVQVFFYHSPCVYIFVFFYLLFLSLILQIQQKLSLMLIHELMARFPTSHLMDVMGIYYQQYWFQSDVEDNFDQHLMLIKAYYCFEKLLEPIKTSQASLPLATVNICLTILFTITLDMQSNVVAAMEAPFHVNPFMQMLGSMEDE